MHKKTFLTNREIRNPNVETYSGDKGLIGYKSIEAKKPDDTTLIYGGMTPEGRLYKQE